MKKQNNHDRIKRNYPGIIFTFLVLVILVVALYLILTIYQNNTTANGSNINQEHAIIPIEISCINQCNYTGNKCYGNDINSCYDNNFDGCLEDTYISTCNTNNACVSGKCITKGSCGDGLCNSNENCTTCSNDCGECVNQIQPFCLHGMCSFNP